MKRLLVLALPFLLASCSKDNQEDYYIADFAPVLFNIEVIDAAGNNLLDTTSVAYDEEFANNSSITIQGKTYHLGETVKTDISPSTRALYVPFRGMTLEKKQDKYLVVIGPFHGDEKWKSENLDIDWGDGTKDNIKFTYLVHFNSKNGEFTREKVEYLFNGTDSTVSFREKGYITLVKAKK